MAGLDPAIHVFLTAATKNVDARHKAGRDETVVWVATASKLQLLEHRFRQRLDDQHHETPFAADIDDVGLLLDGVEDRIADDRRLDGERADQLHAFRHFRADEAGFYRDDVNATAAG